MGWSSIPFNPIISAFYSILNKTNAVAQHATILNQGPDRTTNLLPIQSMGRLPLSTYPLNYSCIDQGMLLVKSQKYLLKSACAFLDLLYNMLCKTMQVA